MDPTEKQQWAALVAHGSPFACIQPNPSMTLTAQNSWGRTAEIHEGEKEQTVRVQLPVMAFVGVTIRAIEFDNGTNPTQLYPYAVIQYGNGNVKAPIGPLDVTGGWSEVVLGSTVELEVFLADKDGYPPEPGSGAYAKIQGWACVGVTPYTERNTQLTSSASDSSSPAVLISGCDGQSLQGRITDIDGFVAGGSGTPSYLLIFDSNVAPGSPQFGSPKILHVFPIFSADVSFDKTYRNTQPFINGVSYALSSSPTEYVAGPGATALIVTVETLRDS